MREGGGWNQEQKPGCGQHREEEEGTTPLTCPKGFGHQPGQIAGDFGPGEVIVVKGFDGWNNERPLHLPRVCSIPHLSRRLVGMEGRRPSHGVAERGVQIVRAGRGPPGCGARKSSAVLVASPPPPAGAAAAPGIDVRRHPAALAPAPVCPAASSLSPFSHTGSQEGGGCEGPECSGGGSLDDHVADSVPAMAERARPASLTAAPRAGGPAAENVRIAAAREPPAARRFSGALVAAACLLGAAHGQGRGLEEAANHGPSAPALSGLSSYFPLPLPLPDASLPFSRRRRCGFPAAALDGKSRWEH